MRTTSLAIALLIVFIALGGPTARAQDTTPQSRWSSTDMAATYSTEQGQITPSGAGSFWMQGASLDGALTFARGFGFRAPLEQ